MTFGALAFLNPWLLGALATLPIIYWLLRTVPPAPKRISFPPTRILVGLENKDKTPAKTPWWLLLIRLAVAALVIFALAEPVLNPNRTQALKGDGPVVIVVDNGWSAAAGWAERLSLVDQLITQAETDNRPVVIAPTAGATKTILFKIAAPAVARSSAAALQPQPFAPDRQATIAALSETLSNVESGISIVWLSDGIDHDGASDTFAARLSQLARGGTFSFAGALPGGEALALDASVGSAGQLTGRIVRATGAARAGSLIAYSARGAQLGEAVFSFDSGTAVAEAKFELPLELRNQVTRIEIAGAQSAGSVHLLDARSHWNRVGLLSGEAREEAQPLLAPLYYIERALKPHAEIIKPKDADLAVGIRTILTQNASVMVLADIGTLNNTLHDKVANWVEKGGVLVRFAGPRLEKAGDDLLPVPLRVGGRTLGGALSWSTPQALADFEQKSPFHGLEVPQDVLINRQVLADPTRLGDKVEVWARLKDGTPLVTAALRGDGRIVLFHVTANTDWSNLPISGLFVEMLQRISVMGQLGGPASGTDDTSEEPSSDARARSATDGAAAASLETLAPVETLDGFGRLSPPPPTVLPLSRASFGTLTPTLSHPPGYYGAGGSPRALNVANNATTLKPVGAMPAGTVVRGYDNAQAQDLKPWFLAIAFLLVLADMLAVIVMQMGGLSAARAKPATSAQTRALITALLVPLALVAVVGAPADQLIAGELSNGKAVAQQSPISPRRGDPSQTLAPTRSPKAPEYALALEATSKVTLGYVLSGDAQVDETSRQGLDGLGRILTLRTTVIPGKPLGVDIAKDEIAFFPVLYWPVLASARALSNTAVAKVDAYMKQGGMIIFDTRDYGRGMPSGVPTAAGQGTPLQRILSRLDIPRLEPVPEGHVLTKSFYILRSFPGRWQGGQMWVEAGAVGTRGNGEGGREARRADGVTSIIITPNDFASAWAIDGSGRPYFKMVPGGNRQRELAFRTGINIVMHALTGNYKADQVHVPALLGRLGQ